MELDSEAVREALSRIVEYIDYDIWKSIWIGGDGYEDTDPNALAELFIGEYEDYLGE